MQSNDPQLQAQTTAHTHLPTGATVVPGQNLQGGVQQGGLVQGLENQLLHHQQGQNLQGGVHQGGVVQGLENQLLHHQQGQNLQGGLVQGVPVQNLGGLNQGVNVLPGQVVTGLPGQVITEGHTHTHHTHHTSHTHHHGDQVLLQQTGVPTTGMTLVSTQVGQTVQVGQPHFVGGEQVYTTLPGVTGLNTGLNTGLTTTTHTHTHGHVGPAIGTGLATGLAAGAGTAAVVNHNLGNDYRGTFVFRPLEGRFTKDKDIVGKMDPYVKIKIGWHSGKSSVAKSEGVNPIWGDVIPLEKKHHEEFAKLKVKDKDRASLNDKIGETKIPLADIAARGRVNQWFPVYKKEVQTGEILLDIAFEPLTKVL